MSLTDFEIRLLIQSIADDLIAASDNRQRTARVFYNQRTSEPYIMTTGQPLSGSEVLVIADIVRGVDLIPAFVVNSASSYNRIAFKTADVHDNAHSQPGLGARTVDRGTTADSPIHEKYKQYLKSKKD